MATWSGWQNQLLRAAHFPTSAANREFLTAWNQHAESNCRNNPVDISKQVDPWSACKHLGPGRTANNYGTRQAAADAFNGQVFGSEFLALNTGFENSALSPFAASDEVIAAIDLWGSAKFAAWLRGQASKSAGTPTHFHQGWNDLRRSVNKRYPNALTDSTKLTKAALRKLAHARRVRL